MARTLYFDCFSGASGDMILGALIDAGFPLDILKDALSSLDVQGYSLSAETVKRSAITGTKFNVVMDPNFHQHSRSLNDILKIIDSSKLPEKVKETSCLVFRRLGEVEAGIHGVDIQEVHFHEIGAVDSIVDIIGSLTAFDWLKIGRFCCSALPLGTGTINTAHGLLPVPAPATLKLIALANAPVVDFPKAGGPQGELLTPTGAALVTMLSEFRRPEMTIDKVGYGAGSKEFQEWPNVLRVWIGEEKEVPQQQGLVLLETNIDDMNPQIYGYLMEKLFEEKAADVWFTPIQMKKNRPAVMLSVLGPSSAETRLAEIIMRETSTLGMRVRPIERHTAERELIDFDSSLGKVRAKIKRFMGDALSVSPEYEDCRRIALERNLPLQEVLGIVEAELRKQLSA